MMRRILRIEAQQETGEPQQWADDLVKYVGILVKPEAERTSAETAWLAGYGATHRAHHPDDIIWAINQVRAGLRPGNVR